MSLQPQGVSLVPEEPARVARAAFPRGNNLAMLMRDHLGMIFDDRQFADLFSSTGPPAASPFRLAVTTVLQFTEGLSDRQAADAVRSRSDWKFALALPLEHPGFDASVLSEVRTRLVAGQAEHRLVATLLTLLRDQGLLKAHRRQRTESTHVLAAVRGINRLELVRDTLRAALEQLAGEAPTWLRHQVPAAWGVRYQPHFNDRIPNGDAAQRTFAEAVGRDGGHLLSAVFTDEPMGWLRELPAVEILRQVWVQNYVRTSDGRVTWRTAEVEGLPPSARFLSSPHELEARSSRKNTTSWIGATVHLTETCISDAPTLIPHVETPPATTSDGAVTPNVHAALQAKGLFPTTHLVDTGYLDAALLVQSRTEYGVDVLGPSRHDQRGQARAAHGFGVEHFTIDWAQTWATCPGGNTSVAWRPRGDVRGNASIYVRWASADCGPYPVRSHCTRSQAKDPRRSIAIRPREQYEAVQMRRAFERAPDFARE